MAASKRFIVWAWEDERLAWRPYDPHVSNFIEQNTSASGNINLGPADSKMKHYFIDMQNMTQCRISTGTQRKVGRLLHTEDSALGQAVNWQFEGDVPGTWQSYDSTFADVLEMGYQNNERRLDLRQPPLFMPYTIDLKKMVQVRVETKRHRPIQRLHNSHSVQYLHETIAGSLGTAPAATGGVPAYGAPAAIVPPAKSGGAYFGSSVFSGLKKLSGLSYSAPAIAANPGVVTRSRKTSAGSSSAKSGGVRPSSKYATSAVPAGYSGKLPAGGAGGARPKTIGALKHSDSISNMLKLKKKKSKDGGFEGILRPVVEILEDPPKDEACCLCMSELTENSGLVDEKKSVVIKMKCKHMYHKSCLKAMFESGAKHDECIQCPTCKVIYGVKRGTCPAGTMTYDIMHTSLPGHSDCDAIRITYDVRAGVQGPEHEHPGERFHTQGFPRIGFIPNNEKGQKVLKLLIKAWERRLTFTIAQSVTTGAQNMVVWNGIHHKTEIIDRSGHGYPAPNFLDNVTMECAALGIEDSDDESETDTKPDIKNRDDSSDDSDL